MDMQNIPSTMKNNLDPTYPIANDRRFGDGCYFSEYPEFSFQYDRNCLLIFKILLVPNRHYRHKSDKKVSVSKF